MRRDIEAAVAAVTPQVTAWRRDLHAHPEVAWTEFRTAARVADHLTTLGWEVAVGADVVDGAARMGMPNDKTLSDARARAREYGAAECWLEKFGDGLTGVVATLDSGRPGPTLAIRVDMDALPVAESESSDHRPAAQGYASRYIGAMHACGHDGHTAIGLGLAEVLTQCHEAWTGRIKLIFQPAEEGVRGAAAMVAAGVVDDVDRLIALHLGLGCDTGTVLCGCDGFLATHKLDVVFTGRSAHAGAEPEAGRNALLAAAQAAIGLHAIAPHSGGPARLNVGRLTAGAGRNVIADRALLEIETRGATTAIDDYMCERAEQVIAGAALAQGVGYELACVGRAVECASSPVWVSRIAALIADVPGVDRIIDHDASPRGSEDATALMARVRERGGEAAYMIFGADRPAGHHQPNFDFDESVLAVAVRALARIALATGAA